MDGARARAVVYTVKIDFRKLICKWQSTLSSFFKRQPKEKKNKQTMEINNRQHGWGGRSGIHHKEKKKKQRKKKQLEWTTKLDIYKNLNS